MKFKNKRISYDRAVRNILITYAKNTEYAFNTAWYTEANKFATDLSVKYELPIAEVCGIIAALSPLKGWNENKKLTESFIKGKNSGHTKLFIGKAQSIINSGYSTEQIADVLKGRKIVSFFLNILHPEQNTNVTIDRHALSVILGYSVDDTDYRGITAKQYDFFQKSYIIASNKVGIAPLEMQSVTWQIWRKEKNLAEFYG
jgi:hypothetical protein